MTGFGRRIAGVVLALAVVIVLPVFDALAAVQVVEGSVESGDLVGYRLSGVKRGDRLSAHLHGTSGNLDPVLAVVAMPFDSTLFLRRLREATEHAAAEGHDLREALAGVAATSFLTWNADADTSYDAVLNTESPSDGDLLIIAFGAPVQAGGSTSAEATFGRFRLVLGLNPAAAVDQDTPAVGESFAALSAEINPPRRRFQRITGEVNAVRPRAALTLNAFEAGDVLAARIETAGDKRAPRLQLLDYGQKVLATSVPEGKAAVLHYQFRAPAQEYRLRINGDVESYGNYKLNLGTNAPGDINDGDAVERGLPVARLPIPVAVSFQLDQIASIVQREEKFEVVATLRMQWRDSGYAFSPATCHCAFKTFDEAGFRRYIDERRLRWPEFVIYNMHGKRATQGLMISVDSSGTVWYTERFSGWLQASDMDFRQFPFDHQNFYVHVDSVFSSERYKFVSNTSKNRLGSHVGTEEWMVSQFDAVTSLTDDLKSRFTFHVVVARHLGYYIMKIFLPLMIILMISWTTFFIEDYNKRIDVTNSHLLLFIAFSFTIANDLPRLGYVTFMDAILACAFVIGGLLTMLNVYLRRVESGRRVGRAKAIDRLMPVVYPIAYFLPWLVAVVVFKITP